MNLEKTKVWASKACWFPAHIKIDLQLQDLNCLHILLSIIIFFFFFLTIHLFLLATPQIWLTFDHWETAISSLGVTLIK